MLILLAPMHRRPWRVALWTVAGLLGAWGALTACDPPRGATAGERTVVIATAGDAEVLVPPLVIGLTARQVTDLLFDPLAEVGPGLNTVGDAGFEPRLADRWTWSRDSLAITFHLDPRARWHDGTPVRASDVRFTVGLARDPATGFPDVTELADVDSVTAPDAQHAVFWFHRRSPEQFYSAVGSLRVLPEARLAGVPRADLARSAFAAAPTGSGPFRFASHTPGVRIEIIANKDYYRGRPSLDRVVWSVTPDPATAVARLLTGEADVFEALRPEQVAQVARDPDLEMRTSPGMSYGYLLFNLRDPATPHGSSAHPVFGDRGVRRALAAALDRRTMVRNVFDTLAAVALGPFTRAQPFADTTVAQPAYDPAAAARALDALGWRPGLDGVRVRGGRRLAFTLLAPMSSQARLRYAVLIQEQLRRVGAEVRVEPLEYTAFMARMHERQFDAAVNGITVGPSARDLREEWSTAAALAPGGLNQGGYTSAGFDSALDRALAAPTRVAAAPWFHRAYQILVDDAPAVWLFEPKAVLTVRKRVQMVGGRPGGWWLGMARWRVTEGRRR